MTEQPGRKPADRQRGGQQGADLLADLHRWLLKSSARNMRDQLGDQVRRTLGGQRPEPGDVWDVATTETPPPEGEAPECQWCPICRAARRMRESGPGIGGQLSGAGDAVAAAVQDAISALDSVLTRAAGRGRPETGQAAGPRGATASTPGPQGGTPGPHSQGPHSQGPGSQGPAPDGRDPWQSATTGDQAGGRADAGRDDLPEGADGHRHGPGDRG